MLQASWKQQPPWTRLLARELAARTLCKLTANRQRWEMACLPYSFSVRVKLVALWWKDEMRREGDALKGLYLFKKRRKPQKKRENELIPSWLVSSCKAAAQRTFLHFSTPKSFNTLSPHPHPPLWRRIKKGGKDVNGFVRAVPNRLRGELDSVSHKNATNTLNGLRVILFSYLHFTIFTAVEG
jgi:hypothetical protein